MKTELLVTCLVASAALPGFVQAQTAAKTTDIGSVNATGVADGPARSPDDGPSATGVTGKELGGGLMIDESGAKSKSSVTSDFIQKQQGSADVFQILKYAPGATAAAGDAWGINQGVISVRGLEGGQLGFHFEGMPMSVSSNWSAFPGQWIDTENTDIVSLTQGSADLSSPDVNASGGVVDIYLHNPSKERGGLISVSGGSNNAKRVFVRGETGEIGQTGLRAFASFSHIDADHFRGPGSDTRDHFALGAVQEWGGGSRTKLALTYTKIDRDTYKNPTLAQWNAGGVKGAATNYSSTYTAGDTSYYKLLSNPWENLLVSLPTDIKVNDKLALNFTPYLFYGYGASGSASVLNENSVGYGNTVNAVDLNNNGTTTDRNVIFYNPIPERNTRVGGTLKGTYQLDNHTLTAGVWYQYSVDKLYRPYSTVNADGTPADASGETNLIRTTSGAVVNQWYQHTKDKFGSIFIGDTINLMGDKLAFDIGGKQMFLKREGYNEVPSPITYNEAKHNPFLPSLAARYKFDDRNSVFASLSKGYRILPEGSLYPRYSASTGALTTAANPNQPSETSTTVEAGYRYQDELVSLSSTLFHYQFKNRQISAAVCDPGCVTTPIDGGKQSGTGVDFEAGLRPINHFRPYASLELLHTRIDSDIAVAGDYLPTTGKNAVRAPKVQAAVAVDYDVGRWFANVGIKYVGEQYSTFMNDEKIPSYVTGDVAVGYRFASFNGIRKPELRLNIMNVGNVKYLSGVYSATTNAKATTGTNGSTIAASAPSYLIANPLAVMLTFSAAF
ncbi:TonB-dependent receptor [Xylophilus rhododendri]|uniref:TonB-dependent receptor n=1 Tax=Xylophilus rhododendri TaxID=2697032 RepID=A0A857J168_9BURK|nr:TonB-dependent receptor [Xylophilus rhododendri]QHI97644.1 TonB-dependent receptor [Xylophilus rhododendri]